MPPCVSIFIYLCVQHVLACQGPLHYNLMEELSRDISEFLFNSFGQRVSKVREFETRDVIVRSQSWSEHQYQMAFMDSPTIPVHGKSASSIVLKRCMALSGTPPHRGDVSSSGFSCDLSMRSIGKSNVILVYLRQGAPGWLGLAS